MKPGIRCIIICLHVFLITPILHADQVHLKNNDRVTGTIVEENDTAVSIKTDAMGTISIQKDFIDNITREPEKTAAREEKKDIGVITGGEIALGYNTNRGNTETEEISSRVFFNRNRKHIDEWTFKGDLFYSEADKKMNARKWYGMGRYAFSFGSGKAWYNFYRLEVDHDRFADVYYRAIPASGVGYWFFDLPETKLFVEAALGLEYTDYYGDEKSTSNLVAVPRLFYEQELFKRVKLTEDIYVYPALTDSGAYRIHSESALTISINKSLGLRLSLIDDYNSAPPEDTKKNDLALMSSLIYSFGR